MKNNYKKQINKYLGQKKSLKEKEISCMLKGKDLIIYSIAVLIKKMLNEILSDVISLYKNESIFS